MSFHQGRKLFGLFLVKLEAYFVPRQFFYYFNTFVVLLWACHILLKS